MLLFTVWKEIIMTDKEKILDDLFNIFKNNTGKNRLTDVHGVYEDLKIYMIKLTAEVEQERKWATVKKIMYVLMCNDYPQYVTADEKVASDFCANIPKESFPTGKWWHYKEVEVIEE